MLQLQGVSYMQQCYEIQILLTQLDRLADISPIQKGHIGGFHLEAKSQSWLSILKVIWMRMFPLGDRLWFMMMFAGEKVLWQSQLQKCFALSTRKAEFIMATKACKEFLCMNKFLQEMGLKQEYTLLCDSQSNLSWKESNILQLVQAY